MTADDRQPERASEPDYSALTDRFGELADCTAAAKAAPDDRALQAKAARLRDDLITECLPLADHIAKRFSGRGEPLEDLVQIARVGLVKAIDRFDATITNNFLSFAVPTVMGEVRRYFRDHTWATHVPRRIKETNQRMAAATAAITQRLGRAPTTQQLADELDVSASEVMEAIVAGNTYRATSLQLTLGESQDGQTRLGDLFGEEDPNFERVEDTETVLPLIGELSDRQRTILQMRFFEDKTQSEIANKLGISQMHVSRILSRTLAQLRQGAGVPPSRAGP